MEDVLSEGTIAQSSPRLALIAVVVGLTIGDAAGLRADEGAASSRQATSGASLFPPQAAAASFLDPPETRQPRESFVPSITTPTSFTPQRLVEQAAQQLAEAEVSLRRQASYSAKASAIESLRLLAEARDYAQDQTIAGEQLRAGLAAIRESSDFMGRYGPIDPDDIQRMVESHVTKTLKGTDPATRNGASAADAYLSAARERLASVATGSPVGTRALVVLAAIYRQEKALGLHADAISLNLLRAAMQSNPSDPTVANELGFLLMKQGILDEAQWALERSMAIVPTVHAAQNLAEVMRQQGNLRGASELLARLRDPRGYLTQPIQGNTGSIVETLTPRQFAALSRPQQPLAPVAAGNIAASPASAFPNQAVQATGASSPVEASATPTESARGPVGRVAKAVSGWFQ